MDIAPFTLIVDFHQIQNVKTPLSCNHQKNPLILDKPLYPAIIEKNPLNLNSHKMSNLNYIIFGYRVERYLGFRYVEFGFFSSLNDALNYCKLHPLSIDDLRGSVDTPYFIIPEKRFIPTQLSLEFN